MGGSSSSSLGYGGKEQLELLRKGGKEAGSTKTGLTRLELKGQPRKSIRRTADQDACVANIDSSVGYEVSKLRLTISR